MGTPASDASVRRRSVASKPSSPGMFGIDEDDVRALRDREADALQAVGRVDDLVAVGREQLPHEQPVARVVLDVEHASQGVLILARALGGRWATREPPCLSVLKS